MFTREHRDRRKTVDSKEIQTSRDQFITKTLPQTPVTQASSVSVYPHTDRKPSRSFADESLSSIANPSFHVDSFLNIGVADSVARQSISGTVNHLFAGNVSLYLSDACLAELIHHFPASVWDTPDPRVNSFAFHPKSDWVAVGLRDFCWVWCGKKKVQPLQFSIPDQFQVIQQNLLMCFTSTSLSSLETSVAAPGLLAVHNSGLLRFWESVAYGADVVHDCALDIGFSDHPTLLINCEPVGFILATSKSLLFKVSLFGPT
ncbi:hypothetical protein HK096_000175, partial [Nowakowskiella sp. JEL0078]